MALDFGLVALAVGAWTGSRGAALGCSTAVAAVAYCISSLSPVVQVVEHIRYLSPIYWSVGADQLREGTTGLQAVLLVATAVVLCVVTWTGLRRLDIH